MSKDTVHLCDTCTNCFATCCGKVFEWGIDADSGATGKSAERVLVCDSYHPKITRVLREPLFTPGPWRISGIDQEHDADRTIYVKTPVHGNPRYIASVYGEGVTMPRTKERVANAVLVGSAPTMFKILRGIQASFDAGDDVEKVWSSRVDEMIDLVTSEFIGEE